MGLVFHRVPAGWLDWLVEHRFGRQPHPWDLQSAATNIRRYVSGSQVPSRAVKDLQSTVVIQPYIFLNIIKKKA